MPTVAGRPHQMGRGLGSQKREGTKSSTLKYGECPDILEMRCLRLFRQSQRGTDVLGMAHAGHPKIPEVRQQLASSCWVQLQARSRPWARSLVAAGQRTHQSWHVHAAANEERRTEPTPAPAAPTAPTPGLGRCRDPERYYIQYPKLGSREQHRTQWTRRCILRRSITHSPIPAPSPSRSALPSPL